MPRLVACAVLLALLGCGKQESPPPRAPAPLGETTPPPHKEASEDQERRARDVDRQAFDALETMKVRIGHSFGGNGYDIALQATDLKEDGTVKPELLKHAKMISRPLQMSLLEIPISDAGVAQLKEIPAVTEIVLSKNGLLSDKCLQSLAGMNRLEKLYLFHLKLTDAAFAGLKGSKGLKFLYIGDLPLGDAAFENIKELSGLESFGIDGADTVTAAGLKHLKSLLKLKRLTLESFKKETTLSAAALKEIGDLAGLEELRLGVIEPISFSARVPWVDDAGVAHLARLKNLKTLNLGSCDKVTDAGIAHLKGLSKLEHLNIGYTKGTDAGMVHLKDLKNLQELNLNGLQITEKGLAQLTGLFKLQRLRLREAGAGVTDAAIQQLKSLTALEDLMLYNTAATEKGAAELKKTLPKLSVDLN
jgi:F-box and leucine-rich repeat protein 14